MSSDHSADTTSTDPSPSQTVQVTLTPEVAQKFSARMLNPSSAMRRPGGAPPAPAVYVGDRLSVRNRPGERSVAEAVEHLKSHAHEVGVTVDEVDDSGLDEAVLQELPDEVRDLIEKHWLHTVRLRPDAAAPSVPVDAWPFLRRAREVAGDSARGAHLDHLLAAAPIQGVPYWAAHRWRSCCPTRPRPLRRSDADPWSPCPTPG